MSSSPALQQRYADLLSDTTDARLLRLVGDLDRASRASRAPSDLRGRIELAVAARQIKARPRWPHLPLFQALRLRPTLIGLLVLLLGGMTGIAYSAQPLIDRVFGLDSGASTVITSDLGKAENLTRTINGFSITVNRVYADANRVLVAYTVAAPPGRHLWNISAGAERIVANGVLLPSRGAVADGAVSGSGAYLQWFDAAGLANASGSIQLRVTFPWIQAFEAPAPGQVPTMPPNLEFAPLPAAPAGAEVTEPPVNQPNSPVHLLQVNGPFTFTASVPFLTGRTVQPHQTVGGITLERVVVTPTETRLYLRGIGTEAAGSLAVNGWSSVSSSTAQSSWVTPDGSTAVSFLTSLNDQHGIWTFTARPVGTATHAGPWTFQFTIP